MVMNGGAQVENKAIVALGNWVFRSSSGAPLSVTRLLFEASTSEQSENALCCLVINLNRGTDVTLTKKERRMDSINEV
jgi:hypothetical protein